MTKKYEILTSDNILLTVDKRYIVKLYRIKALTDVNPYVKKGILGGYIQSEYNLSQYDACWVYGSNDNLDQYACVFENARLDRNAKAFGKTMVCGNAVITDSSWVYQRSRIYGNVKVMGNSQVYGDIVLNGNVQLTGLCDFSGNGIFSTGYFHNEKRC